MRDNGRVPPILGPLSRAALLVVGALLAARCKEAAACPPGFTADAARTGAVEARLAQDAEGASLLEAAGSRAVCWAATDESAVDAERRLLLDVRMNEEAAAARLGHLLDHVVHGVPLAGGCADLARAEAQERRAHALEARLRRTLEAPALPPDALERVLATYRRRCRR
jgi:hypothetical protein